MDGSSEEIVLVVVCMDGSAEEIVLSGSTRASVRTIYFE